MLEFVKKSFMSLYMQYELVTCIYMFEPWEKKLISKYKQQQLLKITNENM